MNQKEFLSLEPGTLLRAKFCVVFWKDRNGEGRKTGEMKPNNVVMLLEKPVVMVHGAYTNCYFKCLHENAICHCRISAAFFYDYFEVVSC